MNFTKRTTRRSASIPISVTEREVTTQSEKPRRCLSMICTDRKFMTIVLIIAVFDALLIATELTTDILGILEEHNEVCNTSNILKYLHDEHHGELDAYFSSRTVDEIFNELEHRDNLLPWKQMDGNLESRAEDDDDDDDDDDDRDAGGDGIRPTGTTEISSSTGNIRSQTHTDFDIDLTKFLSVRLHEVANVFGSLSTIVLSVSFVIKLVQVGTQGKTFFHSKLQVLDGLVLLISLPTDIVFFPAIWHSTSLIGTTAPILFDVSSRIIRVVINSLIILQARGKELFLQESAKLKESTKKHRCLKKHLRKLQELARENGAKEAQIAACVKLVQSKRRKRKETTTVKGILSVNRLLFLAAPQIFPEPNQHILAEEETEEKTDWVHARVASIKMPSKKQIRFADPADLTTSIESLASDGYESYESDEDEESLPEDMTDYNNMNESDLESDVDIDDSSISSPDEGFDNEGFDMTKV